jgi:predicted nucleic acid-binding Zn ribbon protein
MERRKTVHISEVIQELLKKNNMKSRLDETTITQKWEEVVGKTMAKYTQKVYVSKGILYVEVTSSVARNELAMNRSILIERLNEITGSETIKDIIFR